MYGADLAHIHDAGFGEFSRRAAPALIRLLRGLGIRPSADRTPLVAEVGCGSGIVAAALVERGYAVIGIDASPHMIRLARARAPGALFRAGSLESARLPASDAVMAIGEVIAYVQGGLPALRRFFARAHRALRPDGVLIFDFLESAERRTYPPKSFAGSDWALVVRSDADAHRRVLTRRMTTYRKTDRGYLRSSETHRVRIYSRVEIGAALRDAGFMPTMRRSYGSHRLLPGDVAVVAQKL